jgi:ABC-2 type transport system permease protein
MFFTSLLNYGSDITGSFISSITGLLLFFVPILTMRSLADEKKSGTEVLLLTSPARVTEIVMGKFLAAFVVFLVMTAFTFIFPLVLIFAGKPDILIILSSYSGFILMGAIYIAVGIFASSLTENQIIAAVISLVSIFVLNNVQFVASFFSGFMNKVFLWFSINHRFNDFTMGIIDLTSIVFMLSFASVFIFLTIRVVERKRWSQG